MTAFLTGDNTDVADHLESKFESNDAVWQGRVFAIDFPIPIKTFEGEEITGVRFKFGVSPEFLKRSEDGAPDWKDLDLRIRRGDQVPGFQRRSFIEYGDSFIAEIELL